MSEGTDLTKDEEITVATKHRKPADGSGPADPVTADELLETSPFKDDLATEPAARPQPRVRPGLTAYLGAGVLVVAGFAGGVQAQQHWGTQPAASGGDPVQQAIASRFGGARGAGQNGAQQGRSGTGNITVGTVKLVDGKTIYLQSAAGGIVQVKTDGSTKIQVAREGTVKDIAAGSTVVVQGTPGAAGTVKATSVNTAGRPAAGGGGG